MLFNSFAFLCFFAVVVVAYYRMPQRFRWPFLLAASLFYYATFDLGYVVLLLAVILVVYLLARRVEDADTIGRKRWYLATGVLVSLAPLVVFKYFNFLAESIDAALLNFQPERTTPFLPRLDFLLPAGLSFYTFSCVSYLVDVYRQKLPAERHLGYMALYVSFFPKLLAGPIERAGSFLAQVRGNVRFSPDQVTLGLQMILWGLFKKAVIADRLAEYVNEVYGTPDFASPVALVIATYFYAFQIYCDFSGYSDIAIGAARVLGINLMENFRRPYFARSLPEFWGKDRWHISLNLWFRDYLYIPLGGSRVPLPRFILNILTIYLVSGLWHGAAWTFVIWGALNGVYHLLTMGFLNLKNRVAGGLRLPAFLGTALGMVITFHMVLTTWVFFRAESVADAFTVFERVGAALPQLPTLFMNFAYTGEIYLAVALIAFLLIVEALDEWRAFWSRFQARPVAVRWAFYYVLLLGLVVFGLWGQEQFVYMQF